MRVKAVIDSNVLISTALSSNGTPAKLVEEIVEHGRIVFQTKPMKNFTRVYGDPSLMRIYQEKCDRPSY